jgi:hypothetical protein
MKKVTYFLALVFCMTVMATAAQAQVMQEQFVYSTGQLTNLNAGANVSGGNWTTFSGTGAAIQVTPGSLSYTNYLGSAGNKIDIVSIGTSAEDAYRQFTTQTTGTTYAAFLVNVTNTTGLSVNGSTTGDYFAGFLSSTSTIILNSRVSIKLGSVANTYNLGLRASTSNPAATFSSTDLPIGTTQLVVISYQIVAGAGNDVVNMWINPAVGGSEPAATLTQTSLGDLSDVARFFVRQGTTTTPNASIDGIRVDTTWSGVTSSPTAANGIVNGVIADNNGAPIAGAVVKLNGGQNRKTITNAKGYYQFDNVEANGFYTVTPSRANYSFGPANRSFSLIGNHTDAAFTGSSSGDNLNPLDTPEYFVRQQYLDVLGREPDEGGFNYWSDEILHCGPDSTCVDQRRRDVAASFFMAEEFQATGSYIYDMYKGSLGRKPVFSEYVLDRKQVIGGPALAAQKAAFADGFVNRAEFVQKYESNTTAESFVDALLQNVQQSSQLDLASRRSALVNQYNAGANLSQSRSLVLRALADDAVLKDAEYNAAFVLTEYFGYLRRNPEPEGYTFWLNVLNHGDVGNYRGMVCSFITSTEYQQRFSSVVSHSNAECGQ